MQSNRFASLLTFLRVVSPVVWYLDTYLLMATPLEKTCLSIRRQLGLRWDAAHADVWFASHQFVDFLHGLLARKGKWLLFLFTARDTGQRENKTNQQATGCSDTENGRRKQKEYE